MLGLVIINGLIDSFNPCAIGIFLIFLSMLFMMKKEKKHVFQISLVYILAIYISYLLIGLGMIEVIQFFGVPHLISLIGAGIIILVGLLSIKDYFFPDTLFSTKIPYSARQLILKWTYKGTLPAAAVVGVLVGISEFPCSGGIYVTTLGLLSDKTTFMQGFVYLLVYNFMFVLPLIIIYAVTANQKVAMKLMDWQEREKNHMKLAMGIIMTVLGVILIKWYI
jgi:cytochrome c biogenesis protein CcdA